MKRKMEHVGTGVGVRKWVSLLTAGLIALVGGLSWVGSASADQNVNFSFDEGTIQLSDTWAKIIDQDLTPPDAPATLWGNVAENGDFSAAATNFFFPPKTVENLETGNPLLEFVDAKIQIQANDTIIGTFDLDSGAATLTIPTLATITVYPAGVPNSVAKCNVTGFSFSLATVGQLTDPGDATATPPRPAHTYEAAGFAPPLEDGAMLATWTGLPNAENAGGSLGSVVCPALDGMIGGPGGIWLSGEAGEGEPPAGEAPTAAPSITANPAGSTDQTTATFGFEKGNGETQPVDGFECSLDDGTPEPCDSGTKEYTGLAVGEHSFQVKAMNSAGSGPAANYSWTITKPADVCPPGTTGTPPNCVTTPPRKARLANLKIAPKVKAVKRGKKTVIRVRVRNAGNAAAKGVRVCVTAPKRLVKVKKCVRVGAVAAKKTKVARFRVKAKRKKGKAVLKFKATSKNAGKKAGKATIRIK